MTSFWILTRDKDGGMKFFENSMDAILYINKELFSQGNVHIVGFGASWMSFKIDKAEYGLSQIVINEATGTNWMQFF